MTFWSIFTPSRKKQEGIIVPSSLPVAPVTNIPDTIVQKPPEEKKEEPANGESPLANPEFQSKMEELNNSKQAMLNLLEDAKLLEEELKKEKEGVEHKVEERTRELKDQQARLLASINSLARAYVMTNTEGKVILSNTTVDVMFGPPVGGKWTLDELQKRIGSSIGILDNFHKCLEKKETVNCSEVSFGNRFLYVNFVPIFLEGEKKETIGELILVEDITERKIIERSKEEFFSIASHELRTPLTAIRGNTSMIIDFFAEQIKDPQLREMIDDIHESSIRLISIVNDFLDMSRLEQRKIDFKKESFDMIKLIRDVLKEYQATGSEKKLSLTCEEPKEPLPQAFADKDRVKQIIINLVGNGLKFTEKGGITIRTYHHNGFVRVTVEDTGRGIPYENQILLFRKFQQAGNSLFTRDTTKGTGLGLYISKLMAEGMGGTIGLEYSQPGKGSAFAFSVPVAGEKQEPVAQPQAS
jgi:two-component system, OmpR family, phosphate regulon sensor histidine kinase PhoR